MPMSRNSEKSHKRTSRWKINKNEEITTCLGSSTLNNPQYLFINQNIRYAAILFGISAIGTPNSSTPCRLH